MTSEQDKPMTDLAPKPPDGYATWLDMACNPDEQRFNGEAADNAATELAALRQLQAENERLTELVKKRTTAMRVPCSLCIIITAESMRR